MLPPFVATTGPAEGQWRCLKPWMLPQLQDLCGVFRMEAGVTGRSAGLAAASAALLLTPMFHNGLFFPPGSQGAWGSVCRINYDLLAFFFLEAWVKKLTRRDTSLRRVRRARFSLSNSSLSAIRKHTRDRQT